MWIIHIIYLVGEALVTISERWCNLLLHAQWAAACTARGEGADWQAKYHEAAGLLLLLLPLLFLLLLLLLLQGRLLHDGLRFILSTAGMWLDTPSENFKMNGSRVISFKQATTTSLQITHWYTLHFPLSCHRHSSADTTSLHNSRIFHSTLSELKNRLLIRPEGSTRLTARSAIYIGSWTSSVVP